MEKTIENNKIDFKDEEFCLFKAKVGAGEKLWMDNHMCLHEETKSKWISLVVCQVNFNSFGN